MSGRSDGTDGRSDHAPNNGTAASTWAERMLMGASVIFTVVLFSFVLWQAWTTPATTKPMATVTGTETLAGGDVKVTVSLQNAQDVGLVMATAEVDCDTPPPELTFEHVPADDRRTGYVICPPETTAPTATVSTWTEA